MKNTAEQNTMNSRSIDRTLQRSLAAQPPLFLSAFPSLPSLGGGGRLRLLQQRTAQGQRASLLEILDAAIEIVEGDCHHDSIASADPDDNERSGDDTDKAPSTVSRLPSQ
jgi:hypothetical protein